MKDKRQLSLKPGSCLDQGCHLPERKPAGNGGGSVGDVGARPEESRLAKWRLCHPGRSRRPVLNVGKRTVERARMVLDTGTRELIEAVEQGAINVSQGVKVARAPKNTQRRIVKRVEAGEAPIEAMRQVRAEEIEERQIEAPTGKYRVIYADPP